MTSLAARVASVWLGALLLGCTSDHDLLAQKPNPPGPDGAVGDAGSDSFPVTPRDTGTTVDVRDPEPVGPWVLTLMNGVVDVDAVRFCFVPVVNGGEAPPDAPPVPSGGALSFGARTVLSTVGADPATTDVHPYLVLGAVGANAGWSCRRILESGGWVGGGPDASPDALTMDAALTDAGLSDGATPDTGSVDATLVGADAAGADADASDPPAPQALPLPIIPAGTLREARSYLAIATGCSRSWATANGAGDGGDAGASAADGASGEGRDAGDGGRGDSGDANAGPGTALICGTGFGPTTLGMSLVRLSRRTDFAKIGFQTVNASAATGPASLMLSQKGTETMLLFSDALELGQVTPRAQPSLVARDEIGVPIGTAVLAVQPALGSSTFPIYRNILGPVLSSSRIDEASLAARTNFTFVMLGAQPGQYREGAAAFQLRLVENAPNVAGN